MPHLGHAYEKIAADALVRYKRLAGFDTRLVVGSDEHSQSVAREAAAKGMDPQAYADSMIPTWERMYERLQVDYSEFVRTSSDANRATTEQFLQRVYDNGFIYKGKYSGYYCPSCEQYYQERELLDGHRCPEHQVVLEYLEEDNYFLKLTAFTDRLIELHERPDFLQPEARRNEMLNVIREGLQDVSISRGFTDWGFPLPFDRSQVIYVWFDALLAYVTGAGFATDPPQFERYWPCDVHVIGKGITRFHTVMWPVMLWAAGVELPHRVYSHGYINIGGEKMSKSKGIFFEPLALADSLQAPGNVRPLAGSDAARYTMLREVPFDRDGDFTLETFVDRYNADLANDFGNLASRVLKMLKQYTAGVVPAPAPGAAGLHDELRQVAEALPAAVARRMDALDFSGALEETWRLVGRANKYVEEARPWDLKKDPARADELGTVLHTLVETLRILTYLVSPFVPDAADSLAQQLRVPRPMAVGKDGYALDEVLRWGGLAEGHQTEVGDVLFPRLDRVVADG
ncbi:MAG: methionyl-tRNA synthetase [Chloroflexota bacterium]|nr:methionyl-tRNA synthetase [Chloroflexota bacterium]